MKLCLKWIAGLFLFIAIGKFCHQQTRGFTLLKIASHSEKTSLDEFDTWTVEQKCELETILNQPFTFLNSGGQCYAFLSEDGKTVIKFFKQHHIRLWNWLSGLSVPPRFQPFIQRLLDKKIHQSPQFLESCRIAYSDFKERSGLIYLHLEKTKCLRRQLKIIDNLGIAHLVDLDTTDFALQKRVELCHPRIKALIQANDLIGAKQCIDSLIELIVERSQKGIIDRDFNTRTNIGFLGTHAMEIDLGSFTKEAKGKKVSHTDLSQMVHKFHRWLSKQNESLAFYLMQSIEEATISNP